jgi:Cys-rich four helix bundle protein (predicted Tat secretion target)
MSNRRSFLMNTGAFLGASALTHAALAQNKKASDGHHHHGSHGGAKSISPHLIEVQKSADHCLDVGKTCLAHCNVLMAEGDTAMAACQMSVLNMLAVTQAVSDISHYNSAEKSGFTNLLKACIDMCKKCESECKKHADKHAECKACMEACQKCIKSCEAYLKA